MDVPAGFAAFEPQGPFLEVVRARAVWVVAA